jgi:putative transcriptional regulator
MSVNEAHVAKIDWSKVDTTTDADIARHARQDGTSPLSDRAWNGMRVRAVPPVEVPAEVDVRAIREKLKLSQPEFAARFGFTAASVRQWEQGRRRPHGPARVLLTIIAKEPNAVRRALKCGDV